MQTIDTLLTARWIVPVEPAGAILEHHALAIDNGRIADILPITEAEQRYAPGVSLALDRHALIPGLVNAHTHAAMTLFRGLADDRPLMEWLNQHIWPAESRWVDESFIRDGTELAIAEMLRGGITCFNDMYFFPEVTARVAKQAGMRVCVGLIVIDFPTVYALNAGEYLHKGLALHDEHKGEAMIATAFAPHATYTVADDILERIRTYADELDIPIHIHVHETAGEVAQSVEKHGVRPLARLEKLGLVSPSLLAVHMTQLEDDEIARYALAGGHVIHCPESNLKLASGFCPVQKLLNAGVNTALGTDGAASNNDLDLLGEMRTAALIAKCVVNDAAALPAVTALRMATLNGAIALGLGEEIGSLTIGKSADVATIDLGEIETQPIYDPISHLVYAASRNHVTDVWIAGRHLLKDRTLTTLDEEEIKIKAQTWRDKIDKG